MLAFPKGTLIFKIRPSPQLKWDGAKGDGHRKYTQNIHLSMYFGDTFDEAIFNEE